MAGLQEAISILKAEINGIRASLESRENALRVLEDMCDKDAQPTGGRPSVDLLGDEVIDLSDIATTNLPSRKRTFVDEVKEVVGRFGGQEFSIAHVEAVLKKFGVEVSGKTPRSRISMALKKLSDDGFTVVTVEGSGNAPNRYRLKAFENKSDTGNKKTPDEL